MNKKYKLGKDNRETIYTTAHYVGDIIGKTLGPGGRNYLLNSGITNDGKTILHSIRFKDECEDLVSLILMDVADNADKDGGDGTTTATVIATRLIKDIIYKVSDLDVPIQSDSMSVMAITRKLQEEMIKIIELLNQEAKEIVGYKHVSQSYDIG